MIARAYTSTGALEEDPPPPCAMAQLYAAPSQPSVSISSAVRLPPPTACSHATYAHVRRNGGGTPAKCKSPLWANLETSQPGNVVS
eukprot:CAMPEP_0115467056 /NCGR_PEP_ID=MMETSP0271-20121206/50242_1 /TAXON_ID=71861 /ORGANISM="Scrippsiella trochoidea, Strain CCMP3099" /LENGTH=85 /DNA_ID=CAMNT_0002894061 /DNA_START=294 /DNA_END=551 /DNA_ORIENTATION=-